jgi:hypothetical protein|tara:strand:+ start:79 stop:270 length:192 start_codon:yes stop_codon:yes gene_type:complete
MTIAEDLEVGRLTGRPEGVMKEEVSMKKINNKKTISVIDDILKVASTLYFELIFIFLALGAIQ